MNVKGFLGFLLLISGFGIILLAGGCALFLLVIDVGTIKSWFVPASIVFFGGLVSWLGVLLMNWGGKGQAKLQPEEDRKKELEAAMKKRAEEKKADAGDDGKA